MQIKIIQNVYTIDYGMLEPKRIVEVEDKFGEDLVKAGIATKVETSIDKAIETTVDAVTETTEEKAAKKTGRKAKKETEDTKGEE